MSRQIKALNKVVSVLALSLLSLTASAADKQHADKAFVTINGQPLMISQLENLVRNQVARGATDSAELRNAMQNQMVSIELLAQEAKKRGLDKKAEVQSQINLVSKEILQQALVDDFLRSQPLNEAELKNEYDRIMSQNAGRLEYSVRHILVDTEEEANNIIRRLAKGEKFADLSKQSKDTSNANNGGDLGWQTGAGLVPSFTIAMSKLAKGQVTKEPIKTEFGYHVIQVDDTRPVPLPSFEKARGDIESFILRQKVNNFVRELRSKAKIQVAQ
ncbi:MAG: hypothetical protein RIR18_930 [Pseudomonadota bacterium]|jgi:peptidyl-prolyl cis-trans isomerase C